MATKNPEDEYLLSEELNSDNDSDARKNFLMAAGLGIALLAAAVYLSNKRRSQKQDKKNEVKILRRKNKKNLTIDVLKKAFDITPEKQQ